MMFILSHEPLFSNFINLYEMCPLPDAVMDLIMISNGSTSAHHFRLSCISGERDTDGIQLSIKKDNSIVLRADTPKFTVERPQTKEVVATGFTSFDHSGIFNCQSKRGSDQPANVTLINNYSKGMVTRVKHI